jgi:TRAP-type mannitol/chloroaromatic compound transport system permease small subunit
VGSSSYAEPTAKARLRETATREKAMKDLLNFSRLVDTVNTRIGKFVAWFIFGAVLISTLNAIMRKVFDWSSNSFLEIQWILFGAVFLLCAPWTLIANEHIRIDVVSSLLSKKTRNRIDVIGHALFIIPMCLVMLYTALPFFWRSLLQNEQSTNAGGLPVYPAKFFVPLAFFLMLMQGISELIKRVAIMKGELEDTSGGGGHHAAAEAEAQRLAETLAEEAEKVAQAQAAAAAAKGQS